MSTSETIDLIASGEYILILDEALDVVDIKEINRKDYEMLIDTNKIRVNENHIVEWTDDEYDGKLSEWKILCKNGTVVELKKTNKVHLLVWNFNIESFLSFKEIFIMTYLFDASYLKYYFDMHNVSYDRYTIEDFKLIPYDNKKPYNKEQYKNLMNIYQGHLNNIGDKTTALSLNWFKKNKDLKAKLKNNIYNYLQTVTKSKSNEIIWTTFKSEQKYLKGKGYTKSFVSCNTKATNKYKNCNTVVYCCNRYISPDYEDYFNQYNITINQDLYALSEMLQFIWRSAIRDNKPINLYIPSKRMRELLIDWLNNENL
jgi:hypothetical protein